MPGQLGHGRQCFPACPLVRGHAAAQIRQDALSWWLGGAWLAWHTIMLTCLVTVSILATLTIVNTLSTVSNVDKTATA